MKLSRRQTRHDQTTGPPVDHSNGSKLDRSLNLMSNSSATCSSPLSRVSAHRGPTPPSRRSRDARRRRHADQRRVAQEPGLSPEGSRVRQDRRQEGADDEGWTLVRREEGRRARGLLPSERGLDAVRARHHPHHAVHRGHSVRPIDRRAREPNPNESASEDSSTSHPKSTTTSAFF